MGERHHVRGLAATLFVAAVVVLSPAPAEAQVCTWGTAGYRDCVDEKLRKLREAEASGASRPVFPTAPANQRPPQLTPIDPNDMQALGPLPSQPRPPTRAMRQNQRNLDNTLMRAQRDRGLQPIMPPLRNPVPPMPGQICPSQGC
ncbi:MAG: hypothetical protein ACRCU1_06820 [Alsobacter sp.]